MSVFGLQYPTASASAACAAFPAISDRLVLPGLTSPLEVVRLLDNTSLETTLELLFFIDRNIADCGPIGDQIIGAKAPEQLSQALAELFLFCRLRSRHGPTVGPAVTPAGERTHDIEAVMPDSRVLIEVYSPLELAGWRLFEENLSRVLRYLGIPRAYEVSVTVEATSGFLESQSRHLYYPYYFPGQNEVRDWFIESFLGEIRGWLSRAAVGSSLTVDGPGGAVRVTLAVEAVDMPSGGRIVGAVWGTRSNSTRLFFELPPSSITSSEWGKKIRKKLNRRQCGPPAEKMVRLLVLNLNLSDEACFSFLATDGFNRRFESAVSLLVDNRELPFDAVIPGVLRRECGFGQPVILGPCRAAEIREFCAAGELDFAPEDSRGDSDEWAFDFG